MVNLTDTLKVGDSIQNKKTKNIYKIIEINSNSLKIQNRNIYLNPLDFIKENTTYREPQENMIFKKEETGELKEIKKYTTLKIGDTIVFTQNGIIESKVEELFSDTENTIVKISNPVEYIQLSELKDYIKRGGVETENSKK
jgi:hypothetical protein